MLYTDIKYIAATNILKEITSLGGGSISVLFVLEIKAAAAIVWRKAR